MADPVARGSSKLFESWEGRARRLITDDEVKALADVLDGSPAVVDDVQVVGGEQATGLGFSLTYSGDDIPICGNDLSRILELLRRLGTPSQPPIVIVNGRPAFDRLTILATLGVLPAEAWDAVIPKHQLAGRLVRDAG
jgi:hypothetical protein